MSGSVDNRETALPPGSVAVIGFAGRVPGARSMDEFWRNLRQGVESITNFSDEELMAAGVPASALGQPDLVRGRPIIEDIDQFDAAFFGYTPREAEMIDPQQRLFLECAWEALEGAGYDPHRYDGAIGVFAGMGFLSYLLANVLANEPYLRSVGWFQAMIGSDKDFMAPRVSYKLNLRGPSINVVTGCSSSLVGVHLACQSLIHGESDLALAGGSSICLPQRAGYRYQAGSVNSPDGHCRAFDAGANGTIPGDGVAVALLKRHEDAVADGDQIYGVIRGSAVNNDGSSKAGFTAPSVQGQAAVICEALELAGVAPESVTYVEGHGTGTTIGDAIEVAALTAAFDTPRRGYCALGALKANIGHTDTAAGVLGLIKILLAFQHRQLPPTANFRLSNPQIDFANSPFYVNAALADWNPAGPRRAGVSSFSIGGTNAHVVLEEPPRPPPPATSRPSKLVVLSAATETALEKMSSNLGRHVADHPDLDLADVAHTLQIGRKRFGCRRAFVCQDREQAIAALTVAGGHRVFTAMRRDGSAPASVGFLFPGQGSQYVGMAEELYRAEALFRAEVDASAIALKQDLGIDLRSVLYPELYPTGPRSGDETLLNETWLTQPALFVVEYALARLLMEWGISPAAMMGHSIGEYVAACIAGVFSLPDALRLVAVRGRIIQQQPRGAMAAVALPPERAAPFLRAGLSLAAVNGPSQIVLSGPCDAIENLLPMLKGEGVTCTRLPVSHAFHSHLLDSAVQSFTAEMRRRRLQAPRIPFVSNVTGTWITAREATDPSYWGRQLRETVRFLDGSRTIRQLDAMGGSDRMLLEVGPGDALRGLVAQQGPGASVTTTLPRRQHARDAEATLLEAVGKLWLADVDIDWRKFSGKEKRRRTRLPTYPFERRRYWVSPSSDGASAVALSFGPPAKREPSEPEPSDRQGSSDASPNERRNLPNAYVAPRTPTEKAIAAIWEEVTGVPSVGVDDSFFDLGGHSLLAVQIASRLREAFPVEIAVANILEGTPTVAGMAEAIERKQRAGAADEVPLVRVPRGR